MMFNFNSKTLILTGANGGIGREVALTFDRAGANVVLADLELAPMEAFAAELNGPGRKVCLAMDAADPDSAQALVDRTVAEFNSIDYVVPAAGISLDEPFPK